jgi:thioredoxin reductase (NADPH)
MVRPVLLAVDDEPAARSSIEAELRKRYGADYEVICEGSGAAALGVVEQVRARGGQVALVLADQWMPDMTGIELLTKVHGLEPAAKRALLTGWGDLQVGDRLVRAAVLGQVDDWGLKPWQPGDEGFHQLVVGLLYEWAQLHRPGFQAVQVVGEQWSARAHELRDLLARNKVLYGFLPADSEEGRALLERVGATTGPLPVVVTFDGLALRDPSFAEIAEALSAPTRPAEAAYDVTVVGAGPAGLAETMSDYLVRELEATANVTVRYNTEAVAGHGDGRLSGLTLEDRTSGATETVPATALFVLIGAEPHTGWLPGTIRRDRWGFVLTGDDLLQDGQPQAGWSLDRPPMPLETSLPGVFAAGDVRHGSTKRVAGAVGDGSVAIRLVHEYLTR